MFNVVIYLLVNLLSFMLTSFISLSLIVLQGYFKDPKEVGDRPHYQPQQLGIFMLNHVEYGMYRDLVILNVCIYDLDKE